MNKICYRCKLNKNISEFYKRSDSGAYLGICKKCRCIETRRFSKTLNGQIITKRKTLKWKYIVREKVLQNYGYKCVCCGEQHREFLALDHINNDGAKQRRLIFGMKGRSYNPSDFCNWLIKNNYPDNIQILCHNCNCAKQFYGVCPHGKEINV